MKSFLKLGAIVTLTTPLIAVVSCGNMAKEDAKVSNIESISTFALNATNNLSINSHLIYHKDSINIDKHITNKDLEQIKQARTLEKLVKIFLSFNNTKQDNIDDEYKKLNAIGYETNEFKFGVTNFVLDLSVDKKKFYYDVEEKIKVDSKADDVIWFHLVGIAKVVRHFWNNKEWLPYIIKKSDIKDIHGNWHNKDVVRDKIKAFLADVNS